MNEAFQDKNMIIETGNLLVGEVVADPSSGR
jgi:hypothetical protein